MATVIYAFLSLLFSVVSIHVDAESSQKLETYLANFQSMSADFKQHIVSKKGANKISTGRMALQRPGKFRWEINTPSHEIIIADGVNLWIYNADLEQATKQKLDKGNNSPASLLSGDTHSIENRFAVVKQQSNNGKDRFQLKPRSSKDMIQSIELNFVDGKMNQMLVVDNLGQSTVFNFTNIKLNPRLPVTSFKFKPSANVDVIQN